MSRHKLVKNLDLDAELDDYDGESEEDVDDVISPEDKEQLQKGLQQVREIISYDQVPVSDADIEDSLWHYYYDVDKTINYILNKHSKSNNRMSTKHNESKVAATKRDGSDRPFPHSSFSSRNRTSIPSSSSMVLDSCTCYGGKTQRSTRSTQDFFHDMPWLDLPSARQTEILIEPRWHRGRLLGGSLSNSTPSKSKLVALAAARKRENQAKNGTTGSSSAALLDRLTASNRSKDVNLPGSTTTASTAKAAAMKRSFQSRSRRDSSPAPAPVVKTTAEDENEVIPISPKVADEPPPQSCPPSAFAEVMFRTPARAETTSTQNTLAVELSNLFIDSSANKTVFSELSPDDIVLKAQSASKGVLGTKVVTANTVPVKKDPLVQKVKDLQIVPEATRVKSKNLDVVAEYKKTKSRKSASFVAVGHVDAGKSTLMGRLLHDLKAVDARTIEKYKVEADRIGKGSFALAWVLDQGSEERERGVTIDVAQRRFQTPNTTFTILDAPGHQDFIPNMIAGASQADFAILVCDASTGAFESGLNGQTKEHALLVRSIGVQQIIVAINKLDSVQWSQDRFTEIQQQVSAFLVAAGFQLKNLSYVPCSGLTGDNVVHKATTAAVASWYTGPTLLDSLEAAATTTYASTSTDLLTQPLRLTIDDVFRGGIQNPTSISGRIDTGTCQVGDSVIFMPAAQQAIIKGIEIETEEATVPEWAVARQQVVLHLTDTDMNNIRPGDVLCHASNSVQNKTSFHVKLLAFEHILPGACEIFRGRLRSPARIATLEAILSGSGARTPTTPRKRPRVIKPGNLALLKVEIDLPPGKDDEGIAHGLPLEKGNRVVLRAGGNTLGAGLID